MSAARTVIKSSVMPTEMQDTAIQVAQDAIKEHNTEEHIASAIKASFVEKYPSSVWHCMVGRNFGCFVTHEASKFTYFYVGQMGICLFSTA